MRDELWEGEPDSIGPYRLIKLLGAGGMGRVYLGRSAGGRNVAVKVIRAELTADPEFRARFKREVAAARLVSGFYTASLVAADVEGPVPWLATAYVDARSLADVVRDDGPLAAAAVRRLAAGLAEGLAAIHAAGLVHRDLKPSNVLLDRDGPRIIDFGIAWSPELSSLTGTGAVIGSPGYMSPEQAEPHGDIGPASDVFSLGAVLCYAATGRTPWGMGTSAALLFRVVHSEPDLNGVPLDIRHLIQRCLAKDAAERPTPAAIVAELDDRQPAVHGGTGQAHGVPPDAASGDGAPAAATVTRQSLAVVPPPPNVTKADVGVTEAGVPRPEVKGAVAQAMRSGQPGAPALGVGTAPAGRRLSTLPTVHEPLYPRRPRWRVWLAASVALIAVAVGLPLLLTNTPATPRHTTTAPAAPDLVSVYTGLPTMVRNPAAIAVDASHVWVANSMYANSVTELSAKTGQLINTLQGGGYGFVEPEVLASDGTHVWIADNDSNLIELDAATGRQIRKVDLAAQPLDRPVEVEALAIAGGHLWVAISAACYPECMSETDDVGDLAEFTLDGTLVRDMHGSGSPFGSPVSLATNGSRLWVASDDSSATDGGAGSVTEFDASSGSVVWTVSKAADLASPSGITYANGHLWVLSVSSSPDNDLTMTELDAATGNQIGVPHDLFIIGEPGNDLGDGIAAVGHYVYVLDGEGIDQMNADTGALVREISGTKYHFDLPDAIVASGSDLWVLSDDAVTKLAVH